MLDADFFDSFDLRAAIGDGASAFITAGTPKPVIDALTAART